MMKQALVVLALVALAFSAPQPRKLFHEHVEEFLDIIMDEAGHEIEHLMEHYLEYDEFVQALEYMRTNNFKDLIYEMESLPEFVAVVDFLEKDQIDIHYFIDLLNEMIERTDKKMKARHSTSGRDLSSFIRDCIDAFPKDKLSALFDQKMADDEEFKTAIENLQTEEWDAVFTALWDSDVFQAEVKALSENGIDVSAVLDEIVAIFGQN
uniref:Single domain major allergen protein n=1 Tax=Heliothis virescens TaxID=7102 RepID=A0A2A4J0T9_HELVI